MAKKDKKGENTVQNKEIFQRMNFLYQAAMCMATITTSPTKPSGNKSNDSQPGDDATKIQATTDNIVTDTTSHEMVGRPALVSAIPPVAATTSPSDVDMNNRLQRPQKLSRKKTRKLLRERKNKIAMEQISDLGSHHRLTNSNKYYDPRPLSGTARFYASTLMEVGRKNVIRIGPTIKRSVCQRCEALLIPSVSCEVRVEPAPQLNTRVICTACGAFRRFFCMPGKGIEGDRWESVEAIGRGGIDAETGPDSATTSSVTTPAETHDVGNGNAGLEDSVIESAQGMESLILQEDVV
ncbi:Ribonuclease P protein subunit p21 [Linnemannia gamsii]|uniref:Ribonuclease P protein subunit p21 n=1 Tax=Linnemannia gamsii TaxID=64522 RepID=A0ABQ7KEJ2_9FUNG|nr:Ribonuclease P protein subunit p21 [Linnemannia gamsii]